MEWFEGMMSGLCIIIAFYLGLRAAGLFAKNKTNVVNEPGKLTEEEVKEALEKREALAEVLAFSDDKVGGSD